jgi:hypothetical protein
VNIAACRLLAAASRVLELRGAANDLDEQRRDRDADAAEYRMSFADGPEVWLVTLAPREAP